MGGHPKRRGLELLIYRTFGCAVLAATLAGCSGAPSIVSRTPSVSPAGTFRFDGRFDDLNLYGDSLRQEGDRTVWSAREKLIGDCLAASGISYTPSPYPGGPVAHARYSYPSDETVRSFGYEPPPANSTQPPTTPSSIPDSELATRDACNQKVSSRLGEQKVNEFRDLLSQENQTVGAALAASPEYLAAISSWSGCMSKAGFAYGSLRQAVEAANAVRGSGAHPSQPAIDIALADFRCERSVSLLELTHAKLADAVELWVESHQQTIEDYKASIASLDGTAQSLLVS